MYVNDPDVVVNGQGNATDPSREHTGHMGTALTGGGGERQETGHVGPGTTRRRKEPGRRRSWAGGMLTEEVAQQAILGLLAGTIWKTPAENV